MDETTPRPPARAPLPDAWWSLELRTRRLIAGGVVALLVVAVVSAVGLITSGTGGDDVDPDEYVASLPAPRVATWDQLAQCESEARWDADTGNGYYGGLQFTQSSWLEVGGLGNPAHTPRTEQIMRAEFLFDLQGWDAWPVCSSQLGLD